MNYRICNLWIDEARGWRCDLPDGHDGHCRGECGEATRDWFCQKGDFWGTTKQLCLCARCGKSESKRHDEPQHYRGVFTSRIHMICDECFEQLPDDDIGAPIDECPDLSTSSTEAGAGDARQSAPEVS